MRWSRSLVPLMSLNATLRPHNPADPIVGITATRESLLKFVQDNEASYVAAGHGLYDRAWTPLTPPLPPSSDAAPSVHRIRHRVMQFNILAEGLSASPNVSPPLPCPEDMEKLKSSIHGGFDAHPSPVMEQILAVPKRNVRILAEILRVQPTLLALEECDHYYDFFKPALSLLGFDSVFQPKHESPCLEFGYYSDGVALFWRRDQFQLREDLSDLGVGEKTAGEKAGYTGSFVKVCHAMVVLDFLPTASHPSPQPPLVFLTTHLKAKAVQDHEEIRARQVRALAAKVVSKSASLSTSRVVFCGDFNADPVTTSEVHATAVPGLFEAAPDLKSPYPLDEAVTDFVPPACAEAGKGGGGEEEVTKKEEVEVEGGKDEGAATVAGGNLWSTWKRRGDLEVKHFIDYILYDSRSFRATSILAAPKDQDVLVSRLPCLKYPSDHLSIAADLELLEVELPELPVPPQGP